MSYIFELLLPEACITREDFGSINEANSTKEIMCDIYSMNNQTNVPIMTSAVHIDPLCPSGSISVFPTAILQRKAVVI